MSTPLVRSCLYGDIAVIFLENVPNIDPVFLKGCADSALAHHSEASKTIFINLLTANTVSYTLLIDKGGYLTDRYLYDPARVSMFRSKNMENSLWHGDKVPTEEMIVQRAITLFQSSTKEKKGLLTA